MTRVRDDDHPSEVHPHGTTQLNVADPIGEGVAFRYRERDHTLAMQFDVRTMAPSRLIDYVMQMVPNANFTSAPKADANALAHFRSNPLRKAKIRLAQPQNLKNVEPSMASVARSVRSIARSYAAPMISVEIGMGNEGGSLSQDAKRMIEGFVRRSYNDDSVRNIRVTPDNGVGVNNDAINLLDSLLSVKDVISNPSNYPTLSYDARRRIVERALNSHV